MSTVGIIGAGNMGSALAQGLRAADPERRILLYDLESSKAEKAAQEVDGTSGASAGEVIEYSDITVIAIKPQQLEDFFRTLSAETAGRDIAGRDTAGRDIAGRKFISIAAGTRISYFREKLGTEQIVRFMPNLAATVSASVVGVAAPEEVEESFRQEALTIAGALGTAVPLPEDKLSAITGLSGSGIAYVFAFLHAMALGGAYSGIPYDTSLDIAEETVQGALEVLKAQGIPPSEYLTKVASAGGTTIEGIKALEEGKFTSTVMEAIRRAADRASELEG